MTPDLTLARASAASRDLWTQGQRIAIANEMWRRFDALNPYAETVNLGFTDLPDLRRPGMRPVPAGGGQRRAAHGGRVRVVPNMADAAFGYFREDPRDFHLLAQRGDPPMALVSVVDPQGK